MSSTCRNILSVCGCVIILNAVIACRTNISVASYLCHLKYKPLYFPIGTPSAGKTTLLSGVTVAINRRVSELLLALDCFPCSVSWVLMTFSYVTSLLFSFCVLDHFATLFLITMFVNVDNSVNIMLLKSLLIFVHTDLEWSRSCFIRLRYWRTLVLGQLFTSLGVKWNTPQPSR